MFITSFGEQNITYKCCSNFLIHLYLYSPVGQDLAAKYNFRPRNAKAAAKYAAKFPKIKLFTIDQVFGGWAKAQKTHFANGGIYDQFTAEK